MADETMASSSARADVALRDALACIGAELIALGRSADDMQRLIGPLMRQAGVKADDSAVGQAQNLDRIVQRLYLLAARVHAVSAAAPIAWRIEDAFVMPAAQAASGEFELF